MNRSRLLWPVLAASFVLNLPLAHAADFCSSLRTAWLAARQSPESARGLQLAGAHECSFADNDLSCTWAFEDERQGRQAYERFKRTAITCMRPLGLKPVHKILHGVETTSIEAPGAAPNVAVFYPGGTTVTISIVTSE